MYYNIVLMQDKGLFSNKKGDIVFLKIQHSRLVNENGHDEQLFN